MPLPQTPQNTIRKSAKALVYDTLRDWIIDGTLAPGEKLVDSNIAAYFSVSRTPVREALLALSNQKLVEILPSKATIVSYFDMDSIYDLYTAISCLHKDALTLAFPQIDDSVLARLTAVNIKYLDETSANNPYLIDQEFHQIFFDIAANAYLSKFKEELELHSLRVETQFFKSNLNLHKSYHDHQNIILCLQNKDLDGAKKHTQDNFMYTAYEVCNSNANLT